MTREELENKAYRIATGNSLTKSFEKKEYDELNEDEVFEYVWEPFENFSAGELCSHIQQIADEIIDNFEQLIEDEFPPIINEKGLLQDTIEGMCERLGSEFTKEEVVEFLDENKMARVMEVMFEAQSNEIIEMATEMEAARWSENQEELAYQIMQKQEGVSEYQIAKDGE